MKARGGARVIVTKMDALRAERSLHLGEALPDGFRDQLVASIEAWGDVPEGEVLLTRFASVAPSVAWLTKALARMDATTDDAA